MVKFWLNDPYVLLNKKHISNILPNKEETKEQKLNAVTRLVLLLSLIGYLMTRSKTFILYGVFCLAIIILYYSYTSKDKKVEGFQFVDINKNKKPHKKINSSNYTLPTKKNPLMNVLLNQYVDDPKRKPGAPSYLSSVQNMIYEKEIDPNLFKDLGDAEAFHNSMRQFYTTANSQIPNDQKGFLEYVYGNMPSCKDQTYMQCTQRFKKNVDEQQMQVMSDIMEQKNKNKE